MRILKPGERLVLGFRSGFFFGGVPSLDLVSCRALTGRSARIFGLFNKPFRY
jgi:hypothetical protein